MSRPVSASTLLSRALGNGTARTVVKRERQLSMSEFHRLIIDGCAGRCQIGSPACTGRATQAHHVLLRKHGGPNTRDNGLGTCEPCHLYLHMHPAESYANGWLRRLHPRPGDRHFKGE